MNTFEETFPMRGSVSKILRDRDWNVVEQHIEHNVILNIGKNFILKVLTGEMAGRFIATMEVGTGGVDPAHPFVALEANSTNIGLAIPIAGGKGEKSIDSFTYNGTSPEQSVTFRAVFLSSTVDATVSEVILKFNSAGSTPAARHTFPSMYMEDISGYSLEISWTLTFA